MRALSGAILVGGFARRMGGVPKGLLLVHGETVLVRLARLLAGCCAETYCVGDPTGPYAAEIEIPIHPDIYADHGAPGGVHAALTHAQNEWVLVSSCDLPDLDEATLGHLQPAPGCDVVLFRSDGRAQPLAALWCRTALPVLERCLSQGNPGFAEILSHLRVHWLPIDPGGALTNVNTPAEARSAGLSFQRLKGPNRE